MNRLDHLVPATPHLSETVRLVTRLLGVAPVAGGRHPGVGTRNFLLGLGDGGYLEIIGPDPEQPTPDRPRPFGIDGLPRARLVTWAVAAPGIDAVIARARAAGYDPGDARAMSRTTPDGDTLHRRLTTERPAGPAARSLPDRLGNHRSPRAGAARGDAGIPGRDRPGSGRRLGAVARARRRAAGPAGPAKHLAGHRDRPGRADHVALIARPTAAPVATAV
ncbi:VOC family protein [Nocardia sp. BMG111209]|uniref:VOC family protein n=1 Tax=Nocardia sp. BMG111209 TaxID=1160137 RepID=UPI0003A16F84|nr:VOC family protein [Nocardia sp. BMG111209]